MFVIPGRSESHQMQGAEAIFPHDYKVCEEPAGGLNRTWRKKTLLHSKGM